MNNPSCVLISIRKHDHFFFPMSFANPRPSECEPAGDMYIDRCNVTGNRSTYDPLLWHGCQAFHGNVTSQSTTYKNMFCALCNQEDEKDWIECTRGERHGDIPFPFALVMSANVLDHVPTLQDRNWCRCKDDEIYDYYQV